MFRLIDQAVPHGLTLDCTSDMPGLTGAAQRHPWGHWWSDVLHQQYSKGCTRWAMCVMYGRCM